MKKSRKWSKAEVKHWKQRNNNDIEAYRAISKPVPSPTVTKLLRVQNEYFTAGAVWTRRDNAWTCLECAPILKWMRGMNLNQVPIELLKRGCKWSWGPDMAGTSPQQGCATEQVALKGSTNTAHDTLTVTGFPVTGEDTGNAAGRSSLLTPVEA